VGIRQSIRHWLQQRTDPRQAQLNSDWDNVGDGRQDESSQDQALSNQLERCQIPARAADSQTSSDAHLAKVNPAKVNPAKMNPAKMHSDKMHAAKVKVAEMTVNMPPDIPPALLESYEVLQLLGAGGESDVWLARDRVLGRQVVVKRMVFTCELEQVRRDNALNAIAHAGLRGAPQIFAAYKTASVLWLILEHIPGQVLTYFKPHTVEGGLGIGQILCIAIDVMQALDELHSAGWIHGDISPLNVIVDASGSARLIDFGQAGHVGDRPRGGGVPGFSRPADVPDQVMTEHDDTYAMGALLFWLLCGQTPTQIRDANGQLTTIAPWIDDIRSPAHELLWATAQALIEPNRKRRASLNQLVQSLHRDERKLPDGSRANLGRLAAQPKAQIAEVSTPARISEGVLSSKSQWQIPWLGLSVFGRRLAVTLVVGCVLVGGWLYQAALPKRYSLAVAIADIAPSTVLAIPLGDEWVAQAFKQGLGGAWRSAIQGDHRVLVSASCPDQLCQLTLRHNVDTRSHSHQDLVLSAASGEIWTAAIERLARDFAVCEAIR